MSWFSIWRNDVISALNSNQVLTPNAEPVSECFQEKMGSFKLLFLSHLMHKAFVASLRGCWLVLMGCWLAVADRHLPMCG